MTEECERSSGSNISILLLFLPLLIVIANHHDETPTTNAPVSPPVDYSKPIAQGITEFKSYGFLSVVFVWSFLGLIMWKLYERNSMPTIFFVGMFGVLFTIWFFNGIPSISQIIPIGNMTK